MAKQRSSGLQVLLAELGFSTADYAVYEALLRHGRLTWQQLLRATRRAPDEVKLAAQRLKIFYLINEINSAGKVIFEAVDPTLAWGAYRYNEIWAGISDVGPVEDNLEGSEVFTTPRSERASELAIAAAQIYLASRSSEHQYQRTFETADDFAVQCSRSLRRANCHVVAAELAPRLPQVALFWPSILDLLRRGVRYTRYATIDEVFLHGIEIVVRDVETLGIDLQIVPKGAIQHSIYLVDDRELFLYKSPFGPTPFTARVSTNSDLIHRYMSEKLSVLPSKSQPFSSLKQTVYDCLARKRELARPNSSHLRTFEQVARLGKFANLAGEDLLSAHTLQERGVLDRVDGGFVVGFKDDPALRPYWAC